MRILFVEDEEEIRELLSLEFEAKTDLEIVEALDVNEAIETLQKKGKIDLIISDYRMSGANADKLYKHVRQNRDNIPFFLLTNYKLEDLEGFDNFYSDNPQNYYMSKPYQFDTIAQKAFNVLNIDQKAELPEFFKVKIYKFLRFNEINCDVYLKISETKHVKIINENDSYSYDLINKYLQKKVKYFYIKREDFETFCEHFSNLINKVLTDSKVSNKERSEGEITGISFVHDIINNLGVSKSAVETIDNVFKSTLLQLENQSDVFSIIKNIMKEGNYIYEHSLLTLYISNIIALKMNLNSRGNLQKLSIASIMHDITLNDSELARLNSFQDANGNLLDDITINSISKHPTTASILIEKVADFPTGTELIVKDHHEKPDGSGFPRGLTAQQIGSLTALFIISEDFVNHIYNEKVTNELIHNILAKFQKKYNVGIFEKYCAIFNMQFGYFYNK